MSSRAFTVYVDQVAPITKVSTSSFDTSTESGPSSLSATDKENLHPLTGIRIVSVNALSSKRKSSVLVTKLLNPPEAKKLKKEDSSCPSIKKRKVTPSLSREPSQKIRKTKSVTRRKATSRLPSVEEEDKDEKFARSLSQSEIDSRCYDLTVSPLADVSEAFGQPSSPLEGTVFINPVKAVCEEPETLDFTAPQSGSPTPIPKEPRRDRSLPPLILSTPERKSIYASFTFSSPIGPSPARHNPSSSAVKLSDVNFVF